MNSNSTNFHWWQEQKLYNPLTLCILCIHKTYPSFYFEISDPANGKDISFPLPTLLRSEWLPDYHAEKNSETYPRIKNTCQTKSGKRRPICHLWYNSSPKTYRAVTSTLKMGNYDVYSNLRTTFLINTINSVKRVKKKILDSLTSNTMQKFTIRKLCSQTKLKLLPEKRPSLSLF